MTRSDKSDTRDYMHCYICGSPYQVSWRDKECDFSFCETCQPFVRFARDFLSACLKFGICHPKGRVR